MQKYGIKDASYLAAGKESGIRQLVDEFYHQMQKQQRGQHIFHMHKGQIDVIKDKLSIFLVGWLGGPRNYAKKYGRIAIPMVHKHLPITEQEKNDWLFCMQEALKYQDYSDDFKTYLLEQLAVPASRIVQAAQQK